jgi:hypothetical protein
MQKNVVPILFIIALSACSMEPRVDADTPVKFHASMQKVLQDLSAEDKADFQAAMLSLAMSDVAAATAQGESPLAAMAAMSAKSPEQMQAELGSKIDGKTASEIIQLDLNTKVTRLRADIDTSTKDVVAAKAELTKLQSEIAKFEITNPRYFWAGDYIAEPVIAFTIKNNGTTPIATAYFHGKLETPGRAVPWLAEDFSTELSGGLEPGETRNLSLSPNMFGEWGAETLKNQRGMFLRVQLVNFEGPDGKKLTELSASEVAAKEAAIAKARTELSGLEAKLAK